MSADDYFSPKNIWFILNVILILYGLILFFIGKFTGRKNTLTFVNLFYIINILIIQKNILEQNTINIGRPEESIRVTEIKNNNNSLNDDKNINLLDN